MAMRPGRSRQPRHSAWNRPCGDPADHARTRQQGKTQPDTFSFLFFSRIAAGDYIGGGLALLQSGADVYSMMQSCFTAEMLLDGEDGKKRADTIQAGDKLWSRSELEPHGPIELKEG